MNASMHSCIHIFIYIAFYIHISLYYLCILSFMRFYHDLAIHVLSIFLSCMLLLIHIFISYTCFYCQMHLYCISYIVPYYLLCHVFTMSIIHLHVLILVLCHLLLLSIVLSIYAFLSFVLSMFYLFMYFRL